MKDAEEKKIERSRLRERIKELRKRNNLSQSQMAQIIDISQAAYAKIESGLTDNITIDVGKGIAKALEVSFNELFEIEALQNDSLLEELKAENERLEKENERLLRELDNYQTFINLLKDRNMITSPQKLDKGELFEVIESLDELLEESIEEDKQIIEEIKNDPTLKRCLEDGTITTGRHYNVWKEYLKTK
jgi:transcriptional regulator with XRE-family HTH domain